MPVLAIGGAESSGEGVGNTMKLVGDDVQTVVLADCGHWVAEQAPEQLLAALSAFLTPYRDGHAATRTARSHAAVNYSRRVSSRFAGSLTYLTRRAHVCHDREVGRHGDSPVPR